MWSPQQFKEHGEARGVPKAVLDAAIDHLDSFYGLHSDIPALLTLGHLAQRVGVPYWRLRATVDRAANTYRHFFIRKQSGGRRTISVPHPEVMTAQRWLATHLLNKQSVHPASHAFKPGSSILGCAARHCGARWLVKMDVSGFFGSISEIQVFRIFRQLGYQPLVAFELARLTTCVTESPRRYRRPQWRNHLRHTIIKSYRNERIGHLPQGAPTSPMLSNLAMREIDEKIATAARSAKLIYTRYSDDLTFSTWRDFSRGEAVLFTHVITRILRSAGLQPNIRKTAIVPPGARKVVLGLLVDGAKPRLPRRFRDNLRQHLYYLEKFGPTIHMQQRKFETILGMKRHIRGLIDFALMVDRKYGDELLKRFGAIDWPL